MIQNASDFLVRAGGNLSNYELILLLGLITALTYFAIILSGRR